jgi:hypothetical protein
LVGYADYLLSLPSVPFTAVFPLISLEDKERFSNKLCSLRAVKFNSDIRGSDWAEKVEDTPHSLPLLVIEKVSDVELLFGFCDKVAGALREVTNYTYPPVLTLLFWGGHEING